MKARHVYTIEPDFPHLLFHDENDAFDGPDSDDTLVFDEDEDGNEVSMTIPGIYAWLTEFESNYDPDTFELRPSFDVTDWHTRGISLAREIRKNLPDDCELWYDFPWEDRKNRDREAFLIEPIHSPYDYLRSEMKAIGSELCLSREVMEFYQVKLESFIRQSRREDALQEATLSWDEDYPGFSILAETRMMKVNFIFGDRTFEWYVYVGVGEYEEFDANGGNYIDYAFQDTFAREFFNVLYELKDRVEEEFKTLLEKYS